VGLFSVKLIYLITRYYKYVYDYKFTTVLLTVTVLVTLSRFNENGSCA